MTTIESLRCMVCRKLLAEQISSPFRLTCRCGAVHQSSEDSTTVDMSGVKERYLVRFDISD